jgi:trimethylamine:corrinoid methyltransferase-like protein
MNETVRPILRFLSDKLVSEIIDEAFDLLSRYGVYVENKAAVGLLAAAGAGVERTAGAGERVRIPRGLTEGALASVPPIVKLYDRSGEKEYVVGGDEVHFDPGSTAVSLLDHETQAERKAVTADLVRFYRLVETLEHIHFQSTGLISADVPHAAADAYRLYLGLRFSRKPFVTGTFRVEGFAPMRDMLAAVRGGEDELRRRPLAIFDACPSPPLKWSNLTTQTLIDAARAGIPSELISMGMTGATSPVTIAGTLVQHTAENMAGIVISQLAQRGAPVIFGGSPSSFDMRKGTTPMGAIETMIIDCGYAQVGKRLNLPTHAYMGLSDAKVVDAQAGLETGLGAALAALAGVNVVSGPGMLDFESSQSLEKLAIDNEICGMAYRVVAGIAQRESPLAIHLFEEITPESQFLLLDHTLRWVRQEHTFPVLADRDNYQNWVAAGRLTMAQRAARDVASRLARPEAPPPGEAVLRELEKIMKAYAKSGGSPDLPPLP